MFLAAFLVLRFHAKQILLYWLCIIKQMKELCKENAKASLGRRKRDLVTCQHILADLNLSTSRSMPENCSFNICYSAGLVLKRP